MRNLLIFFLVFFISANSLFAQQSIGFSNPDSLQPLLDYRLPDWGYSNFYVDFGANGDGLDQSSSNSDQVIKSGSLRLLPVYNLYRESEQRIFELTTRTDLSLNGSVDNEEFTTMDDTEEREGTFGADITLTSNLKEYVAERSFLYGRISTLFDYQGRKIEENNGSIASKQVIYDRNFYFRPRLGYGFGRIRNVNPAIRAVRLKERMSVLNDGQNFNNQDIMRAADQFTRYGAYQQVYDRPEKYFWNDLDEMTTVNLGSLDTFDMLYLTDVVFERIGTRLEGWEVIGGLDFDYRNQFRRTEDQFGVTDRNNVNEKEIGGFVDGGWYKNTSLKHQWGIRGEAELSYPVGGDEQSFRNPKRNFVINTAVEWLWNITDRILFQTTLSEMYRRSKIGSGSPGGPVTEFSDWSNWISLHADLNFYIENRTSINISAFHSLRHSGDTDSDNKLDNRSFSWGIGVQLRYYFSRNLY